MNYLHSILKGILCCYLFLESIIVPSSAERKNQVKEILKELKSYGFPVLYSSLEMVRLFINKYVFNILY